MVEKNAARPPADHTLRRLEAFSDIVIAFSLSQLAFTLQIPRDSNTLLAHPIHFVAFLGSFALVCAFWWLHHQLFARYFILDPVSVVLNFAFLACTVLVVYSQQLAVRFELDLNVVVAYAFSFGSAYSLLTILYVKGLRDPRLALDEEERRVGVRRAWRLGSVGAVLLGSLILAALRFDPTVIAASWVLILAINAVLRVRDRIVERRGTPA